MPVKGRDPRQRTHVGAYLTDGVRLVWVIDVNAYHAVCEDVKTEALVEIDAVSLIQRWRPVKPLEEAA
jgi:hypothetical protein